MLGNHVLRELGVLLDLGSQQLSASRAVEAKGGQEGVEEFLGKQFELLLDPADGGVDLGLGEAAIDPRAGRVDCALQQDASGEQAEQVLHRVDAPIVGIDDGRHSLGVVLDHRRHRLEGLVPEEGVQKSPVVVVVVAVSGQQAIGQIFLDEGRLGQSLAAQKDSRRFRGRDDHDGREKEPELEAARLFHARDQGRVFTQPLADDVQGCGEGAAMSHSNPKSVKDVPKQGHESGSSGHVSQLARLAKALADQPVQGQEDGNGDSNESGGSDHC